MNLEKLKCSNKFDYKICVDPPNAETFFTYHIVQPFLNNTNAECEKEWKSCVYKYKSDEGPFVPENQFYHFAILYIDEISITKRRYFVHLNFVPCADIQNNKCTCYVEQSAPAFLAVKEGNWNRVENFVRKAITHPNEVITGQFGQLKLFTSRKELLGIYLKDSGSGFEDVAKMVSIISNVANAVNSEGSSSSSSSSLLSSSGDSTYYGSSHCHHHHHNHYDHDHHHCNRHRHQDEKKKKKQNQLNTVSGVSKHSLNTVNVPEFFYKFIKDTVTNEGLVLVTSNNPFLDNMGNEHIKIMCDENLCFSSRILQKSSEGYTYCCDPVEFMTNMKTSYNIDFDGVIDIRSVRRPADIQGMLSRGGLLD